ncbi:hypothetical protein Bsp3421_000134 (plasmid) [Burkholderia sp. FERM BP-3421]|uniref:hypothetical protein n=1 Tax=Burkholderia sp. FERM BP-3421 TaxID=1494466 RepID=UPI002362E4BB|nr:hypothetical protein [Burkholderia sp. FERM BP-3421]WDD90309.1 hypothetical protein Bsp3421_000134 [Burkholderia sp. FERM BP-3421]
MNVATDSIAHADVPLNRADRPMHLDLLDALRCALDAVKTGVPETVGYGEVGQPAFAHGWRAAMDHVYGQLAAARECLSQVEGLADASRPSHP